MLLRNALFHQSPTKDAIADALYVAERKPTGCHTPITEISRLHASLHVGRFRLPAKESAVQAHFLTRLTRLTRQLPVTGLADAVLSYPVINRIITASEPRSTAWNSAGRRHTRKPGEGVP
jgi:hypothetical protein